MAIKSSLDGLKVLVTRPVQQAQQLTNMINNAGGTVIAFPVIEIVTIPRQQWLNFNIDQQDMIIFVSRNAVSSFVEGLASVIPMDIELVAVGNGTAETMRGYKLNVDLQPDHLSGSEGLLLMPEFESVAGKNIIIVRGKGGRELLADSLMARGANIQYIETYERVLSAPSFLQCQQALDSDCIVCTSVAGVQNLSLLLQDNLEQLLVKPLIVVSERIRQYAEGIGFQHIVVSVNVSDKDIMHQLIQMEI